MTIDSTTISGNEAASYGGGIYTTGGQLTVTNSTISGNSSGEDGGGLAAYFGNVSISDSTISDNYAADFGGGIDNYGYDQSPQTISLTRSIVSGNSAGNVFTEIHNDNGAEIAADAYNVFAHGGVNDDEAFYGFFPGDSDVNASSDWAATPLADILSPLGDNGGPTQTHALPENSPALDLAPSGPDHDQRGPTFGRPGGGGFDAGAYERDAVNPPAVVFTSASAAGKIGALPILPGDILRWDGTWTKFFDASVLPKPGSWNVAAFDVPDPNGVDAVLAFGESKLVPGISSKVYASDLVWWNGAAFALWFNGADVTATKDEKAFSIDGLEVLDGDVAPAALRAAAGNCLSYLLVSMQGDGRVPGYDGAPIKFGGEDVLGFCMTQSGATTKGMWTLVLDGSAEGAPSGSIDSISATPDGQTLYLTTRSTFVVDGATGGHSMIYEYDVASGTFSGPYLRFANIGLPARTDGLDVVGVLAAP